MNRRLLLPTLVTAAFLVPASTAGAAFTAPALVSGNAALETDDASQPAISGDGRFVTFTGSIAGVSGVYRRDLTSGALDLVAGGDAGAAAVSADGRYVAFTTTAALDAADDSGGGCSDVYVRDMSVPAGAAGAYTLASARDGSTRGLDYQDAAPPAKSCTTGGSASAGRVSLSADGRRVAFTVLGASDLTSAVAGTISTPIDQVAVRDLSTRTTTLVTQTQGSLGATPVAVSGGGAMNPAGPSGLPNPGGGASNATETSSAAISADGTTVAWMGTNIPSQAPVAADSEALRALTDGTISSYVEPLWRRVGDGPSAATRRITGGNDDPECGCSGPLDTSYDATHNAGTPPFAAGTWDVASSPGMTPQLSADGRTVALLAQAPTDAKRAALATSVLYLEPADLYLVDMTPGLTRRQAVRPITAWASTNFNDPDTAGEVASFALSADGSHLSFTTSRTVFPIAPPALITPSLGSSGNITQLYVADLGAGTMSLASLGYDGAPSNGGTGFSSIDADGGRTAFGSAATNLVFGANSAGTQDVFTLDEIRTPHVAGVQTISAAPLAAVLSPAARRLGLSTHSRSDGRVTVDVTVPDAGKVALTATGRITVVKQARKTSSSKKASATTRAGSTTRTASKKPAGSRKPTAKKPTAKKTVVTKTLAHGTVTAKRTGRTTVRLTVSKRYLALVRSKHGLDSTIKVTFTAKGKPTLRATVAARFRRVVKRTPAKKTPAKKAPATTSKGKAAAKPASAAKSRSTR